MLRSPFSLLLFFVHFVVVSVDFDFVFIYLSSSHSNGNCFTKSISEQKDATVLSVQKILIILFCHHKHNENQKSNLVERKDIRKTRYKYVRQRWLSKRRACKNSSKHWLVASDFIHRFLVTMTKAHTYTRIPICLCCVREVSHWIKGKTALEGGKPTQYAFELIFCGFFF